MAIERHSRLEAQRISGAQAAGEDHALAFFQEQIPNNAHLVSGAENFITKFAGVARAGHEAIHAADDDVFGFRIIFRGQLAAFHQGLQDFFALRSLQGDQTGFLGNIREHRVLQEVRFHVRHVLVVGRCVHHHHVAVLAQMVHDEVVDDAAVFIQHGAVTHAADGEVREIIGQQVIQTFQRALAFENHFAHVGHVENARFRADRHVFRQDALVILHRHEIPAEGYHLSLRCHVLVIQWCFLIHFSSSAVRQLKKAHCKYTVRLCPFDLKDKL